MARRGENVQFPFQPRPYQLASLKARANGMLRGVCIWPRRHGKDLHGLQLLIQGALTRVGLYNYYFPTFSLAKKIVWKGMDKQGTPFLDYIPKELLKPGTEGKNETDLRLEFTNGSIIQLVGTDNINQNLIGINPVGCLFTEYPVQNPMAWDLTRPILAENGGWAWFLYTPCGRNHGYRLYQTAQEHPKDWFLSHLDITTTTLQDGVTPVITPEFVAQEIEQGMDPDLAQQEYYCLSPQTRVLTSHLTWITMAEVQVGDELIGVDEDATDERRRRLRPAHVNSRWNATKPCYRLTLSDGTVVTSSDEHPWLTKQRPSKSRCEQTYKWMQTKDLRVGHLIADTDLRPWQTDASRDGGWLAGLYDGEGCVSRKTIQVAQKPGPVLSEAARILTNRGDAFYATHGGGVVTYSASFLSAMRLLGSVRPIRLLANARRLWNGTVATRGSTRIVHIEALGMQPVVGISTSTKTFIAEGLITHNCSFDAPMQGSFYGRLLSDAFMHDRVGFFPHDPAVKAITAWDIGLDDQTAIWTAQLIGDEIRLIDYYEASGEDFFHYFRYVMAKPWKHREVLLPHDAAKTEWGTGKSAEEIVVKAFREVDVSVTVTPRLDIQEGIGVVRRLFPRMRFHDATTGKIRYRGHSGTDCLASYHKKYNEEKQEYESKPHHNWASHCADALRTLCVGIRSRVTERVPNFYPTQFDPMTYDKTGEYESDFGVDPDGAEILR